MTSPSKEVAGSSATLLLRDYVTFLFLLGPRRLPRQDWPDPSSHDRHSYSPLDLGSADNSENCLVNPKEISDAAAVDDDDFIRLAACANEDADHPTPGAIAIRLPSRVLHVRGPRPRFSDDPPAWLRPSDRDLHQIRVDLVNQQMARLYTPLRLYLPLLALSLLLWANFGLNMAGKEDVAQSTFWFGAVGVGFVYLLAVAKLTRSVRETLSDYERNWAAPNLSYHMDHVGLFSPSRGPILIISGTAFDAPPPMRQTRRLPPPGPPRPSAVTFAGSSTASLYDGNDYVGNGLMDGPAELSLFYRPPAHAYFPSYRGHVPRATYPLLAGGGGGRGVSAASLDPVPAYAPPAAAVEDAGGGDAGGGGGVRGAGAGGRVGWAGMQEPAPAYTPRDAGGVGGVVGRGQGGAAE